MQKIKDVFIILACIAVTSFVGFQAWQQMKLLRLRLPPLKSKENGDDAYFIKESDEDKNEPLDTDDKQKIDIVKVAISLGDEEQKIKQASTANEAKQVNVPDGIEPAASTDCPSEANISVIRNDATTQENDDL